MELKYPPKKRRRRAPGATTAWRWRAGCSLALAWPLAAAAGAPARLAEIEAQLADDPEAVLREAHAAVEKLAVGSDAAWLARLREAAAAGALEQDERVAALLPALERDPLTRNDAGATCLVDTLRIHADRRAVGVEAAERSAERALDRVRRAGEPWCEARLLQARGDVYVNVGRVAQGTADAHAALSYFESAGETLQRVVALADISWLYKRDAENPASLDEAIKIGLQAAAMVDPARQRYLASVVHHNLSGAYLAAQRLAEARRHAMLSRRFSESLGDTLGQAYADRLLGRMDLDEARPAEALKRFQQAAPVFADAGIEELELWSRLGAVEALLKAGRAQEARQWLGRLSALRQKVSHVDLDTDYQRLRLDAAAALRDPAEVAEAARAYADAVRTRERDLNRKTAAELRERFRAERTDAENRHLREQQQVAESRQTWLLATLSLSVVLVAMLMAHLRQQHRLRLRLKSQAETDELTQLPNRRSILATCESLAGSRRDRDRPVCLALLDIDHFKRVNDEFGHQVGDVALVAFAQACRAALRGGDSVGRLGGEEFLLVLPGTPIAACGTVFERLRAQLQATAVPGMPGAARLSCSMGIVELAPGVAVDEALRRADDALYRAKAAGRDRFEVARTGATDPATTVPSR